MIWQTAEELDMELAEKIQKIRKRKKISQSKLAQMCNVSYGSIKRFETTGNISLISLTKICIALDCADQLRNLFSVSHYASIDEVLNDQN